MQRIWPGEQATHRAMGQDGFILVAYRVAGLIAGVPGRAVITRVPQDNGRLVGQRGLLHQAGQGFA